MTTEQNKSPPDHTPAPWWRDDDGFIAAGNGDTYVTIADFDCSNDIDIDEREANKDLALAAPELLEALYELENYCYTRSDRGKQARTKARAAIAKARGQQ
jgi:hypothetical protein